MRYLDSLGGYVIQLPHFIKGLEEDSVYTTTTRKRGKSEQVSFRLLTVKGKDKGGRDKLFIFATNTNLKPEMIRELFRKRWGIETSYRMVRMFHAKTTSKLYRLRILYFCMAVMLYNLWIMLNYKYKGGISAYALKLHVTLSLVHSCQTSRQADMQG